MGPIGRLLVLVANIYLLILVVRFVLDWVRIVNAQWRPSGAVLAVAEAVYSVTDPPLRAIRRHLPPVRIGTISLDIAFIVLYIVISVLRGVFGRI